MNPHAVNAAGAARCKVLPVLEPAELALDDGVTEEDLLHDIRTALVADNKTAG